MNYKATRRRFLVGVGSVAGAVAVRSKFLGGLFVGDRSGEAAQSSIGNFALLGEGDPVPAGSKMTGSIPNYDGVFGNGFAPAVAKEYGTPAELSQDIGVPMYEIGAPPDWLSLGPINSVRNSRGQLYSATIGYQMVVEGEPITVVDVTASEVYLQPMPVWNTRVNDAIQPATQADFLPALGVHQVGAEGHVFHWFERGILYRLRAEYRGDASSAKDLALRLKRV
jgi:hypothetical protein